MRLNIQSRPGFDKLNKKFGKIPKRIDSRLVDVVKKVAFEIEREAKTQ